ncbi:cell envelope integrity protein TolA [Lysobacter silvisoli]|uniref:Protein TolA n=1 Tax=Lysobacter silvisoli TaxID=2293254 RepID=A0A371K6G3_9GAMM|nr:cell envelope integrity protein TolA [Lysobacter silvisoli]RDZ29549.1 protein TolA [Lysobacter silvisoli]
MRETRADTAQAVGLAVLLHGLLILAIVLSALFNWSGSAGGGGSLMQTELVDASELSAAMQRTLRSKVDPVKEPVPEPDEPLPQPEPEPRPQDATTPAQQSAQDFIPLPDDVSQEQVVDTPTPNPATERELQEAKQRQEQVDLTEQQRQLEAQEKQRLAEQEEIERQKKIDEIRRKRDLAARATRMEQQRLEQLADASASRASTQAAQSDAAASAQAGPGGAGDPGLQAAYIAALQAAIKSKWTRPDSVPLGAKCRLVIRQLQGGEVIDVKVSSPCSYDEQAQRSIEAAVLKAQPLPYAGFEKVFNRQLNFTFTAQD